MKKLFRLTALLICAAVLLTVCACSSNSTALEISGAQVDYETFLYFLDIVHSSPEDYGLESSATEEQLTDAAVEQCREYVAVNSWLSERQLTLSPSEKSAASDNLDNLWRVFSHYYEELGVSKQTMMKIMTSDAARDRLFYYVFDEGGEQAVAEDEIRSFYNENYVSFRAINGYLNTTDENGSPVPLSEDEKTQITAEFNSLAQRLRDGQNMNEVIEIYSTQHPDSTVSSQLQFIKKDANSYPDDFFDRVTQLNVGGCAVMVFEEYIFLVLRENAGEDDAQQYYNLYRDDCLKSLRGGEFDTLLSSYASNLEVSLNERTVKRAVREVLKDA